MTEDIFLVSFPKSGNTWLRFLIANAIKFHYNIQKEVNFFTIQEIIPPVRTNSELMRYNGPFGRADLPRMIKSHSNYNRYYNRAILLVRDPRDVMVSYYYYQKGLGKISESTNILEFINDQKYGVKAWASHTESWYFNHKGGGSQIVQILRYEDLLQDTESQLSKLMELIGIKMEKLALEEAVKASSKERMKYSEERHMSTYHIKENPIPFVRNCKATAGQELPDSARIIIENETREIAQILGYKY